MTWWGRNTVFLSLLPFVVLVTSWLYAACNAPNGTMFEISTVNVTADRTRVAVGETVHFACSVTTTNPGFEGELGISWSGAGVAGFGSFLTNEFKTAGTETITATVSGTPTNGPCDKSNTVTVAVVRIADMTYRWGGHDWMPLAATNYVPVGATVEFLAIPEPAGDWPAGKPAWSVASGGSTGSMTFVSAGYRDVTAECGNSITAAMCVIQMDIDPVETNVCWHMTNQVEIVVTNSYAPGGITWSGTNGLAVLSASDTRLVFTPTNSIPTAYVVRAAADGWTNCFVDCTVTVYKVDIEQTNVFSGAGTSNNVLLSLTADSTTNTTWSLEPDLGSNGVRFADSSNGIGVATTAVGTNVWVWPGTIGTTYVIRAAATEFTNCFDETTNVVLKIDMVTPAGDPVNAAVQSGAGQNEFTYSTASPGVLTMNLKAHVTPSGVANQIKDQCLFTVDTIAGSTLAWDAANPGGKPTASGDDLLATVTFTGLPANNTAFGNKKAAVYFNACKQDEENYEVFFPRDVATHPGGVAADPNWFYYWGQVYVNANVQYLAAAGVGRTPAMTAWTYNAVPSKTLIEIGSGHPAKYKSYGIGEEASGIDRYIMTVIHEEKHVAQIAAADALLPTSGADSFRFGWSWNQATHNHWTKGPDGQWGVAAVDDDGNSTVDDAAVVPPFEPGNGDDISLDHATWPWWPNTWALPGGVYATIHPIEGEAVKAADDAMNENDYAPQDWGDPGKSHKTVNKWDD